MTHPRFDRRTDGYRWTRSSYHVMHRYRCGDLRGMAVRFLFKLVALPLQREDGKVGFLHQIDDGFDLFQFQASFSLFKWIFMLGSATEKAQALPRPSSFAKTPKGKSRLASSGIGTDR